MKGFIRFDVSSRKYPRITFSVAYHEDFFFWVDDDSAHDGGKRGILHEKKKRTVLYVYFYTFNEKEQIEFSFSRFFTWIQAEGMSFQIYSRIQFLSYRIPSWKFDSIVSRQRRFLSWRGNDTSSACFLFPSFLPEFAITASCHQYEFKKLITCFSLFPRKDEDIFVLVFPMCRIACAPYSIT